MFGLNSQIHLKAINVSDGDNRIQKQYLQTSHIHISFSKIIDVKGLLYLLMGNKWSFQTKNIGVVTKTAFLLACNSHF